MSKLRDLLDAVNSDTTAKAASAASVAAAEATDQSNATALASSTLSFAQALHQAGGVAVDAQASPPVEYLSTDGQTFTSQPIASLDDPAPTPPAPAPADPTGPTEPPSTS